MKTYLNRTLILTAAVLTLGAAAAHAQNKVSANIPFSFRTVAGEQAAGNYDVVSISGSVLQLRNVATAKATFLVSGIAASDSRNAHARLVFKCSDESGCALSAIYAGDGSGWSYVTPRPKPSEEEHVAVIYLNEPKPAE